MAKDKRRWATTEQIRWLLGWIADYLEAQRTNTFHIFWSDLFGAWFKAFPCREPTSDDDTDSGSESDSGSDVPPESADEREVALSKRKQSKKAGKKKARAKKVCDSWHHHSIRLILYLQKLLTGALTRNDRITGRLQSQKQRVCKI